jgi:hypothetical protein
MISTARDPRFFLVKHDLASLLGFPGRVWQTGRRSSDQPRSHRLIRPGDRWIAYAYETREGERDHASMVQGFYRSTGASAYVRLPKTRELSALGNAGTMAWVIEGEPDGKQPTRPVLITPLKALIKRRLFTRSSVIPLKRDEYWVVRDSVNTRDEPVNEGGVFGSDPKSEQELLVLFADACRSFGVSRISRVGTRFPDLTVELGSPDRILHVELELYSHGYVSHGHGKSVKGGRFKGRPVCVVCWLEDEFTVRKQVPVFELRSLISGRETLQSAVLGSRTV